MLFELIDWDQVIEWTPSHVDEPPIDEVLEIDFGSEWAEQILLDESTAHYTKLVVDALWSDRVNTWQSLVFERNNKVLGTLGLGIH